MGARLVAVRKEHCDCVGAPVAGVRVQVEPNTKQRSARITVCVSAPLCACVCASWGTGRLALQQTAHPAAHLYRTSSGTVSFMRRLSL